MIYHQIACVSNPEIKRKSLLSTVGFLLIFFTCFICRFQEIEEKNPNLLYEKLGNLKEPFVKQNLMEVHIKKTCICDSEEKSQNGNVTFLVSEQFGTDANQLTIKIAPLWLCCCKTRSKDSFAGFNRRSTVQFPSIAIKLKTTYSCMSTNELFIIENLLFR